MSDEYWENKKKSDRNYWVGLISLVLVAVFVPERYCILIFLGAIWMILFEISERLRIQYYFHQKNAESLGKLAKRWAENDDDI